VSAPHTNPQTGGPGTLLLGLPFFSQDDSAVKHKIFTPPLMGLGYADNVVKVYQLEQ
jgi:hypothetical protein